MSERPKRIQRQRTKGWKMPPNTVYVGRPTKWGNPHKVGVSLAPHSNGRDLRWMTATDAVAAYREHIAYWTSDGVRPNDRLDVSELRGKNLCCWCPLDQPCHADVLLELANAEYVECPRCNGAGHTPMQHHAESDENCPQCGGAGVIEPKPRRKRADAKPEDR